MIGACRRGRWDQGIRSRRSAALAALLMLLCAGCAGLRGVPAEPLPPEEALARLRDRAERFSTLVDPDISLVIRTRTEDGTDRSPTLGGHIAFDRRLPALWLNAEKVGRQIFSLRAIGMQFALVLPETGELVTGGPGAYARLPHLVRPEEVRTMFAGPETLGLTWPSSSVVTTPQGYLFTVRVLGLPYRRVLVDRLNGVVRRIDRCDVRGDLLTRVELDRYAPVDDSFFPRRLVVERPAAGVGVELRLGAPELNKEIPIQAFIQPERPDLRHVDLDRQPLSEVEAFRVDE